MLFPFETLMEKMLVVGSNVLFGRWDTPGLDNLEPGGREWRGGRGEGREGEALSNR